MARHILCEANKIVIFEDDEIQTYDGVAEILKQCDSGDFAILLGWTTPDGGKGYQVKTLTEKMKVVDPKGHLSVEFDSVEDAVRAIKAAP